MNIKDFDYELPTDLIAQQPVSGERDQSRLMVVNRSNGAIEHHRFFDLPGVLRRGDLLVFNDSKVFPARVFGRKTQTGGRIELLLVHRVPSEQAATNEQWQAIVGGGRLHPGTVLECDGALDGQRIQATLLRKAEDMTWIVEFNVGGTDLQHYLLKHGHTPIPPYIHSDSVTQTEQQLRQQYQTVYAQHAGSVAAPTAGLHFSETLLQQLHNNGIETTAVTLHVGLGTFAPVRVKDISKHTMHAEYAMVTPKTAEAVNRAKQEGRRVIAVGTTSVRTLESFTRDGVLQADERWTNIFITPGYEFQIIDGIITNFHLPESTLLMLVSAFAGVDTIKAAYAAAIQEGYRFYSFGDAMLLM